MKQFLKILYKILDLAKALTSFLACVYAFFWFAYIFGFEFVNAVTDFIDPIANLTKMVVKHSFTFKGNELDSTYLITAFFFGLIFLLVAKASTFVHGQIETEVFKENIRKAHRDAKTNAKVARTFKAHITKVGHFVIYLNLNLKFAINEILIETKSNLIELKSANYVKIVQNMLLTNTLKTEVMDDRLAIIGDDFSQFDKVFKEFLDNLNLINSENSKRDVATEIYFVLDGAETNELTASKRGYLKKVLSFGYKNRAIATTIFAKRYEQEKERNYVLNTMGKIRFFEDMNEEEFEAGHMDFELFTLRRKKSG